MKLSRIFCAYVCGVLLCAAQTGSPPSGETAFDKLAGDENGQPAPPAANPPAPRHRPPWRLRTYPPARKASAPDDSKTDQELGKTTSTYVIGPLDVLYVRVWNQPNLSGVVDVGPDGVISMPLIGELKADGKTVTQLRDVIAANLNQFINNPEVSVAVTRINSKSVLLIGGVGHPGRFPLNGEKTTVLDAIVGSGGLRDFANGKKIYVLRAGKKIMFNYKDVIQGKHLEQNILLQNGDKVVVPE